MNKQWVLLKMYIDDGDNSIDTHIKKIWNEEPNMNDIDNLNLLISDEQCEMLLDGNEVQTGEDEAYSILIYEE